VKTKDMDIYQVFQPNKRLSLGIKRKNEKGEEIVFYYPSRIEVVGEEELWIAAPQEKGVLVPVGVGEEVVGYVLGENEIFHFEARVRNRLKKRNVAFLVLDTPEEVKRDQRRNYVRINVAHPIITRKGDKSFSGCTKNLSGGGMQAVFNEERNFLEIGEEVLFVLSLPEATIIGKAQVVRKEGPFCYAFQFIEISDQDREEIIHYIFKQQIELRKKGLL